MDPDTIIINLGSSDVQLPKQYYNKSIALANYTRAITQQLHVISTGIVYDLHGIPDSDNATLYDKAKRIVEFERKLAQNSADPEVMNDIKV
jgi:hypothetical protein